jgi:hypothetical protein
LRVRDTEAPQSALPYNSSRYTVGIDIVQRDHACA